MNKNVKQRWLAALRSGEYKQTTGCLRRDEADEIHAAPKGYCCLGVLCDIVDPKGWDYDSEGRRAHRCMRGAPSVSVLHKAAVAPDDGRQDTLIAMNDGAGAYVMDGPQSFDVIANWIEENL